ncbi:MAG: rod shape-determining protein MreD [Acidobacteriota bacterium]|nr:rod shape-determining protein MreD [Blastocatellia bacterium]MDW8240498.1 rod shape-determining protein MreD [Acidobacteriota bacterium]
MSVTKIILSTIAALLIQLLVSSYLRFPSFNLSHLDLVLIVVVYSCFGRDPLRSMLLGAGAGLVQDSFSGGILGTQSFCKTVIAFLTGSLSVRFALDSPLLRLFVMAGASILHGLIFVGLHSLFGVSLIEPPVQENLLRRLAWPLLANFIGAIIIFPLLDRYMTGRAGRRERRTVRLGQMR